jgi:hypothetical protein
LRKYPLPSGIHELEAKNLSNLGQASEKYDLEVMCYTWHSESEGTIFHQYILSLSAQMQKHMRSRWRFFACWWRGYLIPSSYLMAFIRH